MAGKKGKKLARMDLIPAYPLFKLAEVYGIGAEKYASYNWAQGGIPFSSLFAAMIRHAYQWQAGEDIDPENGQFHLASVAWMAFALIELSRTHPEDDDRPHIVLGRAPDSISSTLTNPEDLEAAKQDVALENGRVVTSQLRKFEQGDSGADSGRR